jgi:hypothetical protein
MIFSATNEEGNIFICLFADEDNSNLKYFCREVSTSFLMDLENNRKDVRSIFENPEKLYIFYINNKSEEPIEATETSIDITPFLPDKDLFIGGNNNQSSSSTEYQYNFNSISSYYFAESPSSKYKNDTNKE